MNSAYGSDYFLGELVPSSYSPSSQTIRLISKHIIVDTLMFDCWQNGMSQTTFLWRPIATGKGERGGPQSSGERYPRVTGSEISESC